MTRTQIDREIRRLELERNVRNWLDRDERDRARKVQRRIAVLRIARMASA